jgi:hypothetical protein
MVRRLNLALAAVLATITPFAPPVFTQVPPAISEPIPFGRLMIETQLGTEKQLGFKPPDLGFGFSVEKPIGPHVELQSSVAYSPDKKYISNDGNGFRWGARVIWFPRRRFGISGEIRRSYLWTSQFEKSGWTTTAGVMIRDNLLGAAGRFSVDYVIPEGCVWAVECLLPANGIQSNRTQGPEFYQEIRALSLAPGYTMRFGGRVSFYHFCDQANPFAPAPRTCHLVDTMALTVRLEFGGKDRWY